VTKQPFNALATKVSGIGSSVWWCRPRLARVWWRRSSIDMTLAHVCSESHST